MPIMVKASDAPENPPPETPAVLPVAGFLPAVGGYRMELYGPPDMDQVGLAIPTDVVAWAQVEDPFVPGGCWLDPVFLASGKTWTPDQFRARFGVALELKVISS
ncbi:MAG TPA: hypothetical protein VFY14_03530 [Streptomyces sp.]|nr:hypothetical protein [Streptomyces sp.]